MKKNKQVILDTSFILSAVRSKIDFLEELTFQGLTPVIPNQVMDELKKITKSKKKLKFKDEAKFALMILKRSDVKNVDLGTKGSYVDKGLIAYSKKHKNAIIATMDSELKKKIKNQKLVVRNKKNLMIV